MSNETLPLKKRQRFDDAAAAEGGDDAAHHPSCPEQDPLALFDMNYRSHFIDGHAAWAARAKGIAEQVRFGIRRDIIWWSRNVNEDFPLPNVRLSPVTGVYDFSIDPDVCEDLRSFLADPQNYNEDAVLMVEGEPFTGYARYPYVHAKLGVLPAVQEKKTVRVHGRNKVNTLLSSVPQVWNVVQAVRIALGLPLPKRSALQASGKSIKAMHFLIQDQSQQAELSWHDDSEDIRPESGPHYGSEDMTTVIVSLSEERSGMRVWGCSPFVYHGQGSCVAFHGAALHETLPRARADEPWVVRKFAMFFN